MSCGLGIKFERQELECVHVTGTQLKSDRHWPGSSWNGILFRKLVTGKEVTFEGHGCFISGI